MPQFSVYIDYFIIAFFCFFSIKNGKNTTKSTNTRGRVRTFGKKTKKSLFFWKKVVDTFVSIWYSNTVTNEEDFASDKNQYNLIVKVYLSFLLIQERNNLANKLFIKPVFISKFRARLSNVRYIHESVYIQLTLEFDPGSGRTLAACLIHASRTELVATLNNFR